MNKPLMSVLKRNLRDKLTSRSKAKVKLRGLFNCPADMGFGDEKTNTRSINSVRLVLENVPAGCGLSVFLSFDGTLRSCGYSAQIPLESVFVLEENEFYKTLVLQLPKNSFAYGATDATADNARDATHNPLLKAVNISHEPAQNISRKAKNNKKIAYISIVNADAGRTIFQSQINIEESEECDGENLRVWDDLPLQRNSAFAEVHALVKKLCKTENSPYEKPPYAAVMHVACPADITDSDFAVCATPVKEPDKTYTTGGVIGVYRKRNNSLQGVVKSVHIAPDHNNVAINCEVPYFESPHNIVVYNKRNGQFLARIAFPSEMAENCLKNFLEVNKTPWDMNEKYAVWAEMKREELAKIFNPDEFRESGNISNARATANNQNPPKFSIVTPLWNTPKEYLSDLLSSISAQVYGNYELVLVNASPENSQLEADIKTCIQASGIANKIKVVVLDKNHGITLNTVAGARETSGDYICMLDHDDFISPYALYEYAKVIVNNPKTDVLYCDEDHYKDGEYLRPLFKCKTNLTMLFVKNYFLHFLCIRRSLFIENALDHKRYEGCQDYFASFSAVADKTNIVHVPRILYHWRICETSVSSSADVKGYVITSTLNLLTHFTKRLNIHATPVKSALKSEYGLRWDDAQNLKVAVVSAWDASALVQKLRDLGFRASGFTVENFDIYSIKTALDGTEFDVVLIARSVEFFKDEGLLQMILRAHWQSEVVSAVCTNDYGWINDYGFERFCAQGEEYASAGRKQFASTQKKDGANVQNDDCPGAQSEDGANARNGDRPHTQNEERANAQFESFSKNLRPRQRGRHIFHLGYLCMNAQPLCVDAVSGDFVAMNKDVFAGLGECFDEHPADAECSNDSEHSSACSNNNKHSGAHPNKLLTHADLVVVPDVQVMRFDPTTPAIISASETSVCNFSELDEFEEFCAHA